MCDCTSFERTRKRNPQPATSATDVASRRHMRKGRVATRTQTADVSSVVNGKERVSTDLQLPRSGRDKRRIEVDSSCLGWMEGSSMGANEGKALITLDAFTFGVRPLQSTWQTLRLKGCCLQTFPHHDPKEGRILAGYRKEMTAHGLCPLEWCTDPKHVQFKPVCTALKAAVCQAQTLLAACCTRASIGPHFL